MPRRPLVDAVARRAGRLEKVLSQLDGMRSVRVEFDGKRVVFQYDPAQLSKEAVAERIEAMGLKPGAPEAIPADQTAHADR